jgi:hypothetical protein
MSGFMSGIHAFFSYKSKTWTASEVGLARFRIKPAASLVDQTCGDKPGHDI